MRNIFLQRELTRQTTRDTLADLSRRGKVYRDILQKFMEMWLQIIGGLSQKGHREFKYGHTGTGYLHSYVKKKIYGGKAEVPECRMRGQAQRTFNHITNGCTLVDLKCI